MPPSVASSHPSYSQSADRVVMCAARVALLSCVLSRIVGTDLRMCLCMFSKPSLVFILNTLIQQGM